MSITGYDTAKCQQRNRIAAKRDGINAMPVRLFRQTPALGADLRYAHGTLPTTPETALAQINTLLPENAPLLTEDQVYIHYLEAANNKFIGDRYMFLDGTSLRNFAQDAQAGIAFMNSHRSGGLSHPSELPFGRTFAGRYEHGTDGLERSLAGFYMVRGVHPNGSAGPSTDDLHAMINAGALFDVSVGFFDEQAVCDICGNDLDSADCDHVPGTTHNLSRAQQDAQRARGVPNGAASYTIVGAHINEVSAVYDGAVPGAGFRKTLSLARRRQLTPVELAQAKAAYSALLAKGDLNMDEITDAVQNGFTRALKSLGFRQEAEPVTLSEATVTELKPITVPDPAIEQALAAERERSATLAAELETTRAAERQTKAAAWAETQIRAGKAYPAERATLTACYAQALADDAAAAVTVTFGADGSQQGSRADALSALFAARPATPTLTQETIPAGTALFAVGAPPAADPSAEQQATLDRLLGLTALGQSVRQERK